MRRGLFALASWLLVLATVAVLSAPGAHAAPAPETLYLRGLGVPSGNLWTDEPFLVTLPNFDWWRNVDPGLTIEPGTAGAAEADSSKYQEWRTGTLGYALDGSAAVYLWTAMAGFDNSLAGSMSAYLRDCPMVGDDCTEIATATVTEPRWDGTNDWVEKVFDFGTVTYTVPADRVLVVKITVNTTADDAMWVAYATTTYESRLALNVGTIEPPTTTTTVPPTTTTAPPTTTAGPTTTTTVPPTTTTAPPTTTASPTTTTVSPTTTTAPPTTTASPTTTLPPSPTTTAGPVPSTTVVITAPTTTAPPPTTLAPSVPEDPEGGDGTSSPEGTVTPIRVGGPPTGQAGAAAPAQLADESFFERPQATFLLSAEDSRRLSPVTAVGVVFRSLVEAFAINPIPALLLGLFTAFLVIRGLGNEEDEEVPARSA